MKSTKKACIASANLRAAQLKKSNFTKETIQHLQKTGFDLREFKDSRGRPGYEIQHPIFKLFLKNEIDLQELRFALEYAKMHNQANIIKVSQQSWDGTPISSSSCIFKSDILPQNQLDCLRTVRLIRVRVFAKFGEKKDIIFQKIFEDQISIRKTEKETGMNHENIKQTIKEILKYLLDR